MKKFLLIIMGLLLSFSSYSQCEVYIEPGSVEVVDNGSGVRFTFDVTNDSQSDWYGDVLKMYWSLNSGAPIWNIDYSTGTSVAPILPGETRTITTPWFDIPNLPQWFPEDPGPGGANDEYWVEALEWPYFSANPNGFDGTWSQVNLRLGSCGLADGSWVHNSDGSPYYGPFNSDCPDVNSDALCDCDIDFIGFDPISYDVSIEIVSHFNCGSSINTGLSSQTDYVNMIQLAIHVPGWDYNWGCTAAEYHQGWTWDNPIGFAEFYSGDTINYNLFSDNSQYDDCFQELLEDETLEECLEIVIWQINYSKTLEISDGGWAATCGVCADQTQFYPDINIDMNSINVCDSPAPLYPGCTDPDALNYNPDADFDDGTCEDAPIYGCTDPTACNYNSNATVSDNSCVNCDSPYEVGLEICNAYHNDDSYWDWYISIFGCDFTSPDAVPNFGFNQTACNSGNPVNIWNVSILNLPPALGNATDTLWSYCIEIPEIGYDECFNGNLIGALWIPPGEGQTVGTVSIPESISEFTVNIYFAEDENPDFVYNNTTVYQNIVYGNPCSVLGCTDPNANNYNQFANEDDGSCEYSSDLSLDSLTIIEGCDGSNPYWIPTIHLSNLTNPAINEYCVKIQVLGQTNDTICFNGMGYTINSFGEISIEWPIPIYSYGAVSVHVLHINGESSNSWNDFGEDSNISNNMSVFIVGNPGIECEILGCTDADAINYNPEATEDDGTCEYDILELSYIDINPIFECDSIEGGYYIPEIIYENTGTLEITSFCGTYNIYGSLYDEEICWEGSLLPGEVLYLQFPPVYADGLGGVYIQVNNINNLGGGWTEIEVNINYAGNADDLCNYGCTDPEANNYDPEANVDNGSCLYDVYGCTDPSALNYNPEANIEDGSCEYVVYLAGCTDPMAINYNYQAVIDDGSCVYDTCVDGNYFAPNTFTPNNDGLNDGWTVVTDPECWLEWEVFIYNRWGQLVWYSTTPGEVWIGNMNGGNYYVSDGVYVYIIRGVGYSPANTFNTSGHINVFR